MDTGYILRVHHGLVDGPEVHLAGRLLQAMPPPPTGRTGRTVLYNKLGKHNLYMNTNKRRLEKESA